MSRLRRDPRAERARRQAPQGTTRPRFDIAAKPASARLRRDPRKERDAAIVPGTARLRLDRQQTTRATVPVASTPAGPAPVAAPSVKIVEAPAFWILVVADPGVGGLTVHDRQTLGAARRLAGAEGGVALLADRAFPDAGGAGADRLIVVETVDHPSARASVAETVAAMLGARHVLAPESADGGDLIRRLAAAAGESAFTEIESIGADAVARRAASRGVEQRAKAARFLTVAADAVAAHSGALHEARAIDAPILILPVVTPAERLKTDAGGLPLGEAGFVLSAGNGVTDFDAFRKLAKALGATPGGSRVVCDAGLMPREAQVGASGTVLTADVYVALGIAGAPQHLQGIGACPHVVAINTDLHAAMVERAELSVIADAQAVMAALLTLLAEESAS